MSRTSVRRAAIVGALLAGTAVGVAVPSTAMGAAAAIQDDQLPVTPIERIPQRLNLIQQTGVKVTRVDIFWSDVAPTPPRSATNPEDPAYNWQRADAILNGLRQRGIRPIVSVYSTPQWAALGRRPPVAGQPFNPWRPATPVTYGNFMQAVAKRYPFVRHYEIWNEPSIQLFFRPQKAGGRYVSIGNYANLVKAAYPRIKRANPRAVVIAGVAAPKGRSLDDGVGALGWIRGLRAQRIPLDAYSQHIYPAAGPTSTSEAVPGWNSIDDLLAELDRFPNGRSKQLYITEAGYTTAVTKFRKVRFTFAQQNLFMRQMFALPQTNQPRIPAIVWFNMQDNAFWPGGILTANGTRKPSYATFRSLTRSKAVPAGLR
jgi:hypothetical protein